MLAILTGGLFVAMVVHALLDLQLLAMYRPQLDSPDDAAALINGTAPLASA
jgi:hypothetical protein